MDDDIKRLLKTGKVIVMRQADMLKCPQCIMVPKHYRPDGSCRCDDPDHTEMAEWEYTWDEETQRWV